MFPDTLTSILTLLLELRAKDRQTQTWACTRSPSPPPTCTGRVTPAQEANTTAQYTQGRMKGDISLFPVW